MSNFSIIKSMKYADWEGKDSESLQLPCWLRLPLFSSIQNLALLHGICLPDDSPELATTPYHGTEIIPRSQVRLPLPAREPPLRRFQAWIRFRCSAGRRYRRLRCRPLCDRRCRSLWRSVFAELGLLHSGLSVSSFWSNSFVLIFLYGVFLFLCSVWFAGVNMFELWNQFCTPTTFWNEEFASNTF